LGEGEGRVGAGRGVVGRLKSGGGGWRSDEGEIRRFLSSDGARDALENLEVSVEGQYWRERTEEGCGKGKEERGRTAANVSNRGGSAPAITCAALVVLLRSSSTKRAFSILRASTTTTVRAGVATSDVSKIARAFMRISRFCRVEKEGERRRGKGGSAREEREGKRRKTNLAKLLVGSVGVDRVEDVHHNDDRARQRPSVHCSVSR
jgi:hypothetical protein